MNSIFASIETFFWNLFNRVQFKDIVDILIIAFLLYRAFLITRQTRAGQVLKGFLLLIFMSWFSALLGFKALNWLIMSIVSNGAIVLLILFQPELRRALEGIGRGARLGHLNENMDEDTRIINEISQSVLSLARRRVGALIVFEQKTGLRDFIETGTTIDSKISSGLIINIFEPNTPLHDGAAIIRDDRIAAAGCVLTLSDNSSLGRELGTRHRAGLGVTEGTDAIVIIVSEETGIVSLAQGGRLTRHLDSESLNRILTGMYKQDKLTLKKAFQTFREKLRRREARSDE